VQLVQHLVYEIDRGVRSLALYTASPDELPLLEYRLKRAGYDFIMAEAGGRLVNVFFGRCECLEVLECFSTLDLTELTDEEDFMLGLMLGYELRRQCSRFARRKTDRGAERRACTTQPLNNCSRAGRSRYSSQPNAVAY